MTSCSIIASEVLRRFGWWSRLSASTKHLSNFKVAEVLLHILEMMLARRPLTPDGSRRRNMENLVAAHERLWHLRHPNTQDH